jgi:hypothetical protein
MARLRRITYELMESAWPAVARDENAPRAMREWARKLEAKPKYGLPVEQHLPRRGGFA